MIFVVELNDVHFLYQGKAVTKALHMPSNYHDTNYQRFVRVFSLQIKEQPIKVTMKQMFTFNHGLLKSVSLTMKNIKKNHDCNLSLYY